jgi:type 1 fimbria pilin
MGLFIVFSGFAFYPAAAQSSGTVTINGRVFDATCEVDVNGVAGNTTVTLPDVLSTQLDVAGKSTGFTPIDFALRGCTPLIGLTNVVPLLRPAVPGTSNPIRGTLLNTAASGPATNVEVAIALDSNGSSLVNLNGSAGSQGIVPRVITSNPTFNLFAGYLATGQATGGNVQAQLAYTLSYL